MSPRGTTEALANAIGDALAPLADRLTQAAALELFADLGLEFPPALTADAVVAPALSSLASSIGLLKTAIAELESASKADDSARVVAAGIAVLASIGAVRVATTGLGTALSIAAPAAPAIPAADVTAFADALPRALLDDALVTSLAQRAPSVLGVLVLLGIADRRPEPGTAGDPNRPPYIRQALHLERLGSAIASPMTLLESLYGWGTGSANADTVLSMWRDLLALFGAPLDFKPGTLGSPPSLESTLFDIRLAPDDPRSLDFIVHLGLPDPFSTSTSGELFGSDVEVFAKGTFSPEMALRIAPPWAVELRPDVGQAGGKVGVRVKLPRKAGGGTRVLFGLASGSRLEAESIEVEAGLQSTWDPGTSQARGAPLLRFSIVGGRAVIDLSSGDGFVKTLTGGTRLESAYAIAGSWSPTSGLTFDGSAGVEIAIPVHVTLGAIDLKSLFLRLGFDADGSLPIELSGAFSAALGPIEASVDRIGMTARARFPASADGNLGPLDLGFEFRPPTGVGLSIDAGVVKGGGFLSIDAARGEYTGVLELDLSGIVTVKAIGLITTKMPDGSPGFSLLIIITAEFGTGIQLGFGFTLLAVGGLLGLNRTMVLAALAEGVRSNAITSVMFPRDVLANAPRIISDLRVFFPPREGTFLIGPMVKLGWGTPTLISLSLGVIIEIPGNVAIVGVLRLALPADELGIIVLQVNFIGAIEFDKARLWFFAALFDSHILFLTIEGEIGVLAAFGDDASLVLSVGGFHPSFNPPPLPFPTPRRISVDVLDTPVAKLRVEGYFAVTSNTAQFGARVDARLGFDDFGISGYLAFDALFQFSPLHFIVAISAGFSLNAFGVGVMSISLHLQLEGVSPWRAQGTGSISILFFDIDVDFDITWGEGRETTLPPIAVMPLLKAEYDKPENWRALLPVGNNLLVSLRKLDPVVDTLVLHPVGVLRVSQRAVPLDLAITKVGNQAPTDAKRFSLSVVSPGLAPRGSIDESFAPAQFQDFDDADKLTKPAFQPMHSGLDLSVAGDQVISGAMVKRVIRYELITIDSAFRRFQRFFVLPIVLLTHFLRGAAVTRSPLSNYVAKQKRPFDEVVAIVPETFVVASQIDNRPLATFTSQAMALDHLASMVAVDPNIVSTIHVIPSFEAAA